MQQQLHIDHQPSVLGNEDQLGDEFGNFDSVPNLNKYTENTRITKNDGNDYKQVSQIGGQICWYTKLYS